jgi:hypothetical protein
MAQALHKISNKELSINEIEEIIFENRKLALSEEAKAKIVKCRKYLDRKLKEYSEPIYGINTGLVHSIINQFPKMILVNCNETSWYRMHVVLEKWYLRKLYA